MMSLSLHAVVVVRGRTTAVSNTAIFRSCNYHHSSITTTTTKLVARYVSQQQHRSKPFNVSSSLSLFVRTLNHEPPAFIHCKGPTYVIRSFQTTPLRTADTALATATDVTTATTDIPPSSSLPPKILWTTHRLKPEQIQKIDIIFHKILWLDLFEASMLNEIINHQMGVSLNPKQKRQLNQLMEQRAQEAVGNAASNNSLDNKGAEEVETGPVLVDMKLMSYDAASKIKVIKEVRAILNNLVLKEAKEMVESAPVTLQKGMKPELAAELKTKLEAVGATIDIV